MAVDGYCVINACPNSGEHSIKLSYRHPGWETAVEIDALVCDDHKDTIYSRALAGLSTFSESLADEGVDEPPAVTGETKSDGKPLIVELR